MAVTPQDASTVILLRDLPDSSGFEVLMVLRHPKSSFVPGSYVFPGGCLNESDYAARMEGFCTGIDEQSAVELMDDISDPCKAIGIWVAGIRETFEEVGLILAYRDDVSLCAFNSDEERERFRTHRKLFIEEKRRIQDILIAENLTLAADQMHYFSHWITPELLQLRYDVRFFVARAPDGQHAVHDGVELTQHVWITPQDALKRFETNRCNMVLPTYMTICELSQYSSVGEVIASTVGKEISGMITEVIKKNDDIIEYMPDGRAFRGMPRSLSMRRFLKP
jgi:8-oxo-dGTP pyrophosphatase MutT (NUDIX family)